MEIFFASQNQHKVEELQHKISTAAKRINIQIVSLKDIGFSADIPETHDTLEGNALEKARFIYERFHKDCISDDTGLEIEALNGEPGVYSARYAGIGKNFDDNMNLVLEKMQRITNRKACFRTVIALILEGKEYTFEGRISGQITTIKKGGQGFGYDPIFQPDGFDKTFAELNLEEKNKISHRALAIHALIDFLSTHPYIAKKHA